MKKHSKKILAVFAMVLALACALTACAPAASSSGNAESQGSLAPASSAEAEKPVTLKYISYGAKPDTGNCDGIWAAMNEILLRDLNCTVDVEYLGSGDVSQMSLKYAGNEEFDFAYSARWFGFADLAQNNAFYELKMDELKQYAPYMVENLPDIGWKQASIAGKIYMLPNIIFEYTDTFCVYRGDLLEKYNMDKLETIEDLEQYMEAVVKNETGIGAGTTDFYSWLWMAYPNDYKAIDWAYCYDDPNQQEIVFLPMTDAYMDYAKKMRTFYEKGIIAADAVNDSTPAADMFKNGLSAVYNQNLNTTNQFALDVSKEHPEWKIGLFNPYKGRKVMLSAFNGNGFVITRSSQNPTKAIEVVNHIYESEELQKLLNYGIEGVDYEMKDGKLYVLPNVPADKKKNIGSVWNMNNSLLQSKFVVKEKYENYQEIWDDLEKNTVSHPLQAFTFDKSAVETETANVSAVQKEYQSLSYGMNADVEATVEEYRKALKDAGYEAIKAEYDRQIKEFMATYNK